MSRQMMRSATTSRMDRGRRRLPPLLRCDIGWGKSSQSVTLFDRNRKQPETTPKSSKPGFAALHSLARSGKYEIDSLKNE